MRPGEEHIGGQAAFRFGAAAAPLLQKRRRRAGARCRGCTTPSVPSRSSDPPARTCARRSCPRSPATDKRRTSAVRRPHPAGRADRCKACTAPTARRDANNRARSAPAPGPPGILFHPHVLRPQPLHRCVVDFDGVQRPSKSPASRRSRLRRAETVVPPTPKPSIRVAPPEVTDAAASPSRPVADCSLFFEFIGSWRSAPESVNTFPIALFFSRNGGRPAAWLGGGWRLRGR